MYPYNLCLLGDHPLSQNNSNRTRNLFPLYERNPDFGWDVPVKRLAGLGLVWMRPPLFFTKLKLS
jgi:hypothetical protein